MPLGRLCTLVGHNPGISGTSIIEYLGTFFNYLIEDKMLLKLLIYIICKLDNLFMSVIPYQL
jgi:hypothetical protein